MVWLDEVTLLALGWLRPRFNTNLRSLIQEISSNMRTVNVAVIWNIQQPLTEFENLPLLLTGIHSKENKFLMPWSLYTLYVSSQQCLWSYTAQTRARRNAPSLQWGRSGTEPQEWDGEGIWEATPTRHPQQHPGWNSWWKMNYCSSSGDGLQPGKTPEAEDKRKLCQNDQEQQDGSWWHVWQEREQAPLTAALLHSAHCQTLLD